ncbi:MAG: glutamate--tRNA ligase [Thaumarchaeota archaeon]|nr:glutamate--tRNA ligase [Nitrososphaerota archaeon]
MSISEQDRSSMEKYALQNAVRHGGKAEVGAVISKVLGDVPSLRSIAKEVARAAAEVVRAVNALSPQQQEQTLRERYPEALQEHKQEQRVGLPPLEDAVRGRFVVRLPPEPSGYMTIGHAMAGTINDVYRQMYDGQLWLRFEDTNPRKVQKRYYESFRRGYSWLGIKWDHEKNVSSDIDLLYEHIQDLLEAGTAYACACPPERMKKLRFEGIACEHRAQTIEKNVAIWDEMLGKKHREGTYVIRLKGDLSSLDYSLRDPNIARIIDYPHPLTGDKYIVWPTYDFEVVVEDQVCSVTHVLRSSEFHLGLQELIRSHLGFPAISVKQFSRFNFKGTPVSKRLLRPLVEEKLVTGWDDPRMPTVDGIIRRGILPATIRQFTIEVGYTKSEHVYDWSLLFAVNRKILDPVTKRFYFVPDPVKLTVQGAPARDVVIPYHPFEKLGTRTISTAGEFYVPSADVAAMAEGQVFRMIELFNVELVSRGPDWAVGRFAGDGLVQGSRKLQWVVPGSPTIQVLEPGELYNEDGTFNSDSLKTRFGYVEQSFRELKEGEIVQFPRYGFVRVDGPDRCVLAHN